MVGTIIPMVHGEDRRRARLTLLGFHTAGYILGAAAVGCSLGWAGGFVRQILHVAAGNSGTLILTSSVGLLYSTREFGIIALPLPHRRRQVPRSWVTGHPKG